MAVLQESSATFQHLSVAQAGAVAIARFCQPCVDQSMIEEVFGELSRLSDCSGCRRVVLNFASVVRLPSMLLGKLLGLSRKLADKKGKLLLCEVRPEVRSVLAKTKLDQILQIRQNEADALET
jgi:anti-anti-sigma factor